MYNFNPLLESFHYQEVNLKHKFGNRIIKYTVYKNEMNHPLIKKVLSVDLFSILSRGIIKYFRSMASEGWDIPDNQTILNSISRLEFSLKNNNVDIEVIQNMPGCDVCPTFTLDSNMRIIAIS